MPDRTKSPKIAKLELRAEPQLIDLMKFVAAWRGRSAAEELRLAAERHAAAQMLDLLDDPEFVTEVRADRDDFDVEEFRAQVERDLADVERRAAGRPAITTWHSWHTGRR